MGPSNLRFYYGDFEDMLNRVRDTPVVDFAFIDSGPPFVQEWEHTVRWRHYNAVKPFMAPGGLVISHDNELS
jgi:hypothetical protein